MHSIRCKDFGAEGRFFVGFYAVDDAKGKTLATIVNDVLLRLQLPISLLRGHTYDGAANMADTYNGAHALIRQDHNLALYVHCFSHCVNLATEAALLESSAIRDSLNFANEREVISSKSGKLQVIFSR